MMHNLGYPSRSPDLDVYPGFVDPPEGYGEVAFYWWVGEPLTKERLAWQLEQLKDRHISALQINYAHSDQGGEAYGLTISSEPPLFSDEWWELFVWFAEKAGSYGIAVSLSDYTLCAPGQGWYTDEILAKKPDISGLILKHMVYHVEDDDTEWKLPEHTISITALLSEGELETGLNPIDLTSFVKESTLNWQKPSGEWNIVIVYAERQLNSIDPMNEHSGSMVIEHFFQRFEDKLAGMHQARLGFFFSDELDLGIKGNMWNDQFRELFMKLKGYDIVPELAALFMDIGPRTPKIRLDYSDVIVRLSEQHYFIPIYEWHRKRGLIYGCDHGGRGKDTTEFGDYFRTQRWNQGPGCDQPLLQCDLIKNKVASSIAHLYERPRTWLEGFYGSGWGTSTADLTDAIFKNFVTGHNLLTLHGLYYTTYGGWWEWAPPCNHFRMPYWQHMQPLLACTERLSYLLSQGVHICDVAVMYPVASMEAAMDGEHSVNLAFDAGEYLYRNGIDFDFIDFESLERAETHDGRLLVAGEAYRVLILPAMRALRYSTLQKALEFYKAGGLVLALERLPEASERKGRNDSRLDDMVSVLFGCSAKEAAALNDRGLMNHNDTGGVSAVAYSFMEMENLISRQITRDFYCSDQQSADQFVYIQHRHIGARHIYAVYGAAVNSECFFRCHGELELWNPWNGSSEPLQAARVTSEGTYLRLPLGPFQVQLIVFTPRAEAQEDASDPQAVIAGVYGDHLRTVQLDGEWSFRLRPTMDNRFGDYRQPPENHLIGAEARQFRFALEEELESQDDWSSPTFNDSEWQRVTYSYGPYLWKLGPLFSEACTNQLEAELIALSVSPEGQYIQMGDQKVRWSRYEFSMRYGIEHDPGHQGYHGLKGEMSDDFIATGHRTFSFTETEYSLEEAGEVTYYWSSFDAKGDTTARICLGGNIPDTIWLNGSEVENNLVTVNVLPGMNYMLIKYSMPGRGHVIVESISSPEHLRQQLPLAMSWFNKPGVMRYDVYPNQTRAGWYRFSAAPGLESFDLVAFGSIQVWVNGVERKVEQRGNRSDDSRVYHVALKQREQGISVVAIRMLYDKPLYGGAAFPEPIQLRCGEGEILLGDWSLIDSLTCYSGGAVYRKQFNFTDLKFKATSTVKLDLGNVSATAEIHLNGHLVQTLVSPPWQIDVTSWVREGNNNIEIVVYNTLANHYVTIPTRYRGNLCSGLLGPVKLLICNRNH
ncbi:glycosyl hydrolase [Paenibacillus nasutitermitis]|uniref:Glycosyl hydrolases family 2 sugar binding domain-containing protein n=1 Tax=Paenibacillus nasutitermitis TaxID=1652958 RepID=A0A916ZKR4_9BACL|nr:glycosyl hydrolase [Paenibacillus nasutitermitis]GGE02527.1 hypothetical protein GCM10010911_71950 [Paenibacillus nasutitermitis]